MVTVARTITSLSAPTRKLSKIYTKFKEMMKMMMTNPRMKIFTKMLTSLMKTNNFTSARDQNMMMVMISRIATRVMTTVRKIKTKTKVIWKKELKGPCL